MTRDEAIRRMEICRDFLANNYSDMGEPNLTAFNMAIQALSQEPTISQLEHRIDENTVVFRTLDGEEVEYVRKEPCDDAISRAEAMTEIMMFAGNVKPDEEDVYIKVSDAVQLLRELPPVTPKSRECEDVISQETVLDQLNQSINILEATDRIKAMRGAE